LQAAIVEIGNSGRSTQAIHGRVDDAQPWVGCLGETSKAQRVEGRATHQTVGRLQ